MKIMTLAVPEGTDPPKALGLGSTGSAPVPHVRPFLIRGQAADRDRVCDAAVLHLTRVLGWSSPWHSLSWDAREVVVHHGEDQQLRITLEPLARYANSLRCPSCSSRDAWSAGRTGRALIMVLGCDSCAWLSNGDLTLLEVEPAAVTS